MTNIAHSGPARVTVGVDTHKDEHVAVAIDALGARLGEHRLQADPAGYRGLERWAAAMGQIAVFGVEGTGSYGAGLARFLAARGHKVIEVFRPDRSIRRRLGKSDPIDAEAAARAMLADTAQASPKSGTNTVEMIRTLKVARNSAVKARTQAINQMKALVVTAPADLRQQLKDLTASRLVRRCARFRPGNLATPADATKLALRSIARRYEQLSEEITLLFGQLVRLTAKAAPALLRTFGVGANAAAALLITAGDNPGRLRSEAAFAALCGVSPIPASSGKTNRHRLSRGGDRQANCALHRVVLVRLRHHEPTKEYMRRRTAEGMAKKEVIRCLKRYVAREVYAILQQPGRASLAPAA